jgi:hypothetical protein
MVARNFDQWTTWSCACVGRERGRRTLHCEWWVRRRCWIGGPQLEVGRYWPGLAMCISPRSEVTRLARYIDVGYLYAESYAWRGA